jgi:signal transduction histidine kinase
VRSIVVVDATPATLHATSEMLRQAGFQVREVATGLEGVVAAATAPIDLVVLDLDLPDIDGYEVCRRIRALESRRRVRVLYLSASFSQNAQCVRGFEEGADGFLTHPVDPAVLIATVGALLRTRAIEVELEGYLGRERLAREEAERANRAKDDFLATLSHELRTPLTAIVGWADVARLLAHEDPKLLAAVDVIARNARLQAQLISDLLDVSSISAGKMTRLDLAPVSLTEIVEGSLQSIASAAVSRTVRLERELSDETFIVQGNADRLTQVCVNLLNNAVKFSDPGDVVRVRTERQGGAVVLTVIDEGRGIRPELLPRVFDRFWQEENTSRRTHGGMGLGLSIVKHLTELHHGTVQAASDGEGCGATFTVTLPLDVPAATGHEPGASFPGDAPEGEISLQGVRVLIVDDDDDGREWIKHVVSQAGADAVDASSVTEALATARDFAPHVVVSDLAMPGRNGFDLLSALRTMGNERRDLPVIALSAFASAEDRRSALQGGFEEFFAKPPVPNDLLRAIWRVSR